MPSWFEIWRDRRDERIVALFAHGDVYEIVDGNAVVCRFTDEDQAVDWLIAQGYEDVTGSANYADEDHPFPLIGGFKRRRD